MSSAIVAAGAAAVALYVYAKQRQVSALDGEFAGAAPSTIEACRDMERPPSTVGETLYYFKEVFRYMYHETFSRWGTVDLFVGLAYLSHRAAPEYPAADLVAQAEPIPLDQPTPANRALLGELREVRRFMLFCRGLRLLRPDLQTKYWHEQLGIEADWILKLQSKARLMRPAFVVIADAQLQALVVCVRGTQSMQDMFTSLTAPTKPHHMMHQDSVLLGYSHLGMLAAARWLTKEVSGVLRSALEEHPDYKLRIVGHSMGAGTAVMLTMMLRDADPALFSKAHCYAIACPACMTLELATSCRDYVTAVVNGTDIVPTFSSVAVDALRKEVIQSSWFAEFQTDLRSSVFRAVQGGMRGVGAATTWTTRNVLMSASVPFRACYVRRPAVDGKEDERDQHGAPKDPGMLALLEPQPGEGQDGERDGKRDAHSGVLTLAPAPLQERVMQDTLESCLYAVGSTVHPNHHHHHHSSGHHHHHHSSGSEPRDVVMDQPGERGSTRPLPLLTTATVQHLRRRMWPWSTAILPGGGGTGGTGGAASAHATSGRDSGGGPDASLPSVAAFADEDAGNLRAASNSRSFLSSPSAQWRQMLGQRAGQTKDAAQKAGDWIWSSFSKSFSASRQFSQQRAAGEDQPDGGGDGLAAASGPSFAGGLAGRLASSFSFAGRSAGRPASGGSFAERTAGRSNVKMSSFAARRRHAGAIDEEDGQGSSSSDDEVDDDGAASDEDEAAEEEDEDEMLASGVGRSGQLKHDQLQAGITAVVAAVSNEDENPDSPAPTPAARKSFHSKSFHNKRPAAAFATSAAPETSRTASRMASRTASMAVGGKGNASQDDDDAAAKAADDVAALEVEVADEVAGEMDAGSTDGGGGEATGAEQAAATPKVSSRKRLYPAGRILHLFPAAARAQPGNKAAAAGGTDGTASSTAAVAPSGTDGATGRTDPVSSTATPAGFGVPSAALLPFDIATPLPPVPREMADAAAAASAADDVPPAADAAEPSLLPFSLCHMPSNAAYGRIRLCKSMVADHMIPAYLVALNSVVEQLEAVLEPTAAPATAAAAAVAAAEVTAQQRAMLL